MKIKRPLLVSLVFIYIIFLNISCGSNNDTTHSPLPPPLPSLNHIEGSWRITRISTRDAVRSSESFYFQSLLDSGYQIQLKIHDQKGRLELHFPPGGPSCTFNTQFTIKYCCPAMRKIFLTKDSSEETPKNCLTGSTALRGTSVDTFSQDFYRSLHLENTRAVTAAAAKSETPPKSRIDTFQFTYSGMSELTLDGPYDNPLTRVKLNALP